MLDVTFTLGLGLALLTAAFGSPALLALYLVLVLPISLVTAVVVRRAAHSVMDDVGLTSRNGPRSWLGALLSLHPMQAPLGAWSTFVHVAGRKS